MLTEGEFVMSRGAVQKIGVENLMRMNASGGGTNVPRIVNNTIFAQGGGPVGEPMIPDPTALTVLRASGMASRQGLQGTRGMGGRGLGGTLELGYHGTSQSAGRSIRQGGFLPGSRRIHLEQEMFSLLQLQTSTQFRVLLKHFLRKVEQQEEVRLKDSWTLSNHQKQVMLEI